MPHLSIELLLWMLLAFLIGCILGCFLRKLFWTEEAPAAKTVAATGAAAAGAVAATAAARPAPAPVATPKPQPAPAPKPQPVAAPMPAVSTGKPARPKGLAAARGGKGDNLQIISGVGPKLEKTLHGLGFFHFDQISNWSKDEVSWVDEHLRFKGRIEREEWIPQCRLLAAGEMAEFEKKYGTGGLRNSQGARKSGSRTRRPNKK